MRVADPFLAELEQEAATTRRLFEHVPADRLGWKPHEKSLTLGQLTSHVATLPGFVAEVLSGDSFDFADATGIGDGVTSVEELLVLADENLAKARGFLAELDDERALGEWRLLRDGQQLMAMPRVAALRGFLLNHLYHHRGQISVYLRIAGAHVPSVHGPTADENPFG